jgi:hypothetical protein
VSVAGDLRFAARSEAAGWIFGAASTESPATLTFGGGRVLRVVVRDGEGRPAEGALVRVAALEGVPVQSPSSFLRLGATDDAGVLLVAVASTGRIALEATLDGMTGTGEVALTGAGTTEVVLTVR